jgi:uncharacterized membrane protein YfhO
MEARGTAGRDPLLTGIVEAPGLPAGTLPTGAGTVTVLERRVNRQRLRVTVAEPGGLLAIARTFDPCWKARVDGSLVPSYRSEGFLTALFVPAGTRDVELRYENGALRVGMMVTCAAAALLSAMLFASRAAREA